MASKTFELDNVGQVIIVKRRSNRHLRLTIASDGQVRVSIPTWAPYAAGLDFARSKQRWITQRRSVPRLLTHDQTIGRTHHLKLKPVNGSTQVKSRVAGNLVTISFPPELDTSDPLVQSAAAAAASKALRQQAESLLPKRLSQLSEAHQLPYSSVQIKQLSRRWGSCDHKKQIVLNLYLIQLPWELIDYVLLHELTHTKYLNHSPEFWGKLEAMLPDAKTLKKSINVYHPGIIYG